MSTASLHPVTCQLLSLFPPPITFSTLSEGDLSTGTIDLHASSPGAVDSSCSLTAFHSHACPHLPTPPTALPRPSTSPLDRTHLCDLRGPSTPSSITRYPNLDLIVLQLILLFSSNSSQIFIPITTAD
ncbi:hypothetical protein KSP39_PZI003990 [Platanthera zijinensis]|uniref:Uncharacterized protein n=1 Tax=Platanthera zijinensis TaxID=2320716 RepID=A0AAP0GBU2_9ASPA